MSIRNVEKSRRVLPCVSKTHGIDINPCGFSIYAGVRYVLCTRYALRGEGDLYHIEAKLYRLGKAHISILRSKNIDKNA